MAQLKVTKPVTLDGITPAFDDDGVKILKVSYMPDTKQNRRLLDELNEKLPTALKIEYKIDIGIGDGDGKSPKKSSKVVEDFNPFADEK